MEGRGSLRLAALLVASAVGVGLGACFSSSSSPRDAGPTPADASLDQTTAVSPEGGTDTGAPGPTPDSSTDAAGETSSDAPVESSSGDAGAPDADAGTADGALTALVTGLANPYDLVLSSGLVVWIDGTTSSSYDLIRTCPVTGCTAPKTIADESGDSGVLFINFLTADATNVYYTAASTGSGTGLIKVVPIDGSTAPTVIDTETENLWGMAIDSTGLYWVDNSWGGTSNDGALLRCDPANCAATRTVLLTGQPRIDNVALTTGAIYWAGEGNPSTQSYVRTCAKGACDAGTTLMYPDHNARTLRLDPQRFYFQGLDPATSRERIKFCPLSGCDGGLAAALATDVGISQSLVADGTSVYFMTDAGIVSCPATGCPGAAAVHTPFPSPVMGWAIVSDGTFLYFTSPGDGALYRVAK
jgi:hypothetical protein